MTNILTVVVTSLNFSWLDVVKFTAWLVTVQYIETLDYNDLNLMQYCSKNEWLFF